MFKLLSTTPFPESQFVAKRYVHDCGMEVLSLEADDAENLFALCFKTEPTDNTGVAHILEHSVLEGSRKYPVKDPFVCMLKGSVATFINACTYPDRTIYPCMTCCRQDYFNLFEVYWDAVFHPRLNRDTFGQEGWHYEVAGSPRRPKLLYNGIVLNEMQGYYSDPQTLLGRAVEERLFPDAPVRFDAGGAPASIPQLTYAKFQKFHHEWYNPSVTRIVLYGDIPTQEKLDFIESRLKEDGVIGAVLSANAFPSKTTTPKAMKPVPSAPRVLKRAYAPAGQGGEGGRQGICALAWRLDCSRDPDLDLGFSLLETVLLGNAAAPLRRALLESRLGTAEMGSGYDNETKYTTFQVGLRGVCPKDFPKVEELVMQTLRGIVADGLQRNLLEAAVAEFQLANQNVGSMYPFGLLEDICASWNYSDDPFLFLRQSSALPKIQEMLQKQPRYLEGLIQKWLLDNPARVRVELHPDARVRVRQEKAVAARLARRLARWSSRQLETARKTAARLQANALTPDTPEALATLPRLKRGDLPAKLKPLPLHQGSFANGLRWQRGDVFHNGITHLKLMADASAIPAEQLVHTSLLLALLPKLGNATQTYDVFTGEMARLGFSFDLSISSHTRRESPAPYLLLNISCAGLDQNFEAGLQLVRRQLDTVAFTERRRLVELLRAAAARATAALATRKSLRLCHVRAEAGLAPFGYLSEQLNGFAGYQRLQQLAKLSEKQLDECCEKLQAAARVLRTLPVFACGFVGSDTTMAAAEAFAGTFAQVSAPVVVVPPVLRDWTLPQATGRHELCTVNTQVASCLRLLKAPHRSDPRSVPLSVLNNLLSVGYLWDEVRAKGGAYYTGFRYNAFNGTATLEAADDPQPANTFRVFDALPDFLSTNAFSEAEVSTALLSTAGAFLRPDRPAELSLLAVRNLWQERTEETRQQEFDKLLELKSEDIRRVALELFDPAGCECNDCAVLPQGVTLPNFTPIHL